MQNSLFDLSRRTALVTGGSKGLGKAIAGALVAAGANVVIASRHEEELRAACDELHAAGNRNVRYIAADLSNRDEADRLADAAIDAFGAVDVLVNNAGTSVPQAVDEIDDQSWDRVLELNLSACMALSRRLAPPMKQRRWGRIIHISSIMGLSSKAGRSAYSATKSALIGMARAGALDLGPFGVTVNCIAPGPFLTDLPKAVFTEEQIQAIERRTALGRWGDPAELAGPVLLLASDAGSYITGATLVVDGGALCMTM